MGRLVLAVCLLAGIALSANALFFAGNAINLNERFLGEERSAFTYPPSE